MIYPMLVHDQFGVFNPIYKGYYNPITIIYIYWGFFHNPTLFLLGLYFGDSKYPRTGNPVLNQDVQWNDRGI